jgi:hypothetical protein
MNPFQIPDDLSAVSNEELSGLLETAKTDFNTLYTSEDVSNETLEAMEELANAVEEIVTEQNRRVTASAKREELSTKAAQTEAPVEAGSSWYGGKAPVEAGSSWYSDKKVADGSSWYHLGSSWYTEADPTKPSTDPLGSSWYQYGSSWYKAADVFPGNPDATASNDDNVELGSSWYSDKVVSNGSSWYKLGSSWYTEADPAKEGPSPLGSSWYQLGSSWYKAKDTNPTAGSSWYATEEVVEASSEETEPEVAEAVVEAAVEATDTGSDNVSNSNTDAEEGVLVATSKPNTTIAIPERAPQVLIAAAVDVPQYYVGQRLDPKSLADALHNKARMLSDSRGAQTVYPVATIERPFGEGYDLEGLDQAAAWDAIAQGTNPSALTASGGWCAPSTVVYDLFETECETGADSLFSLPTFRVTRGGIRWPVFIPHDASFDPGFVWTEANDIAATSGSPTKPCVSIPCPTFTECRLDATGLCVTAGNLMDRAYPEQVSWFLNRAIRAYERNSSIRQLTLVLGDTIPVTQPASFGAMSALLDSLLLQAVDFREANGLCCGQQLDLVLPCFAQDILRSDIARQSGTFSIGNLPTNADVTNWLESVGLTVRYINYWQGTGNGPATAWPATIQYLLGYPGSYLRFDQGRLDLGVIRDSVLNATNDYTAVWFEEFYCIGRRGPQSRLVTVTVCASGDVGGRVTADGAPVCP